MHHVQFIIQTNKCTTYIFVVHLLVWIIRCIDYSFIVYSVLRQVSSVFQSEFFTECDLVLPISMYGILFFPQGHTVSATSSSSSTSHFYLSVYFSFRNVLQKAVHTQDVTNPASLPFIAYMIFLSSFSLCFASFLTRTVQLIVSILLQHHASKLSSYF